MASLLSLPSELVDDIIENVLVSSRPPPKDPETASTYGQPLPAADFCNRSWNVTNVLYETCSHQPLATSLSLLLVNKKIHSHTKKAIERLSKAQHLDYRLDVMLVNETQLWPTFLSGPLYTTRLDTVHTDIRIFAKRLETAPGYIDSFRGGDGSPPDIVWAFYALLERFLQLGAHHPSPADASQSDARDDAKKDFVSRDVTIGTLSINFSTPEDPSCVLGENESPRGSLLSRNGRNTLSPKFLANFIATRIRGMLTMNYHYAEFGGILYEHIGSIRICVDNELESELDLGRELRALHYTDPAQTFGHIWPRELRLPAFARWKQRALHKRKQCGLDP